MVYPVNHLHRLAFVFLGAFIVTVLPVKAQTVAPPTPVNDSYHLAGTGPFTLDVLANDTDSAGLQLTIASVTNGGFGTTQIVGNKVVYTPGQGYNGNDTFTYTVSDGQNGTAQATVTLTNRAPILFNYSFHQPESGPFAVNVLAFDSDPDGDTLTVASATNGATGITQVNGNQVTFTPGGGYNGNDSFTYTVTDGHGGSGQATVTFHNQAPAAANDTFYTSGSGPFTIDVLANDTDADGDALSIVSATNGAAGTAQISSNKIVYTPGAGYSGSDSFTYTISDGYGGTAQATVHVIADTPKAVNDSYHLPSTGASTLDVLANDSDPAGYPLSIAGVSNGTFGTTQIANNKVVYTPGQNFAGNDSFTYYVVDSHGASAQATVTIVNQAPGTINDRYHPWGPAPFAISFGSAGSDPDGDSLSISSVANGSFGTVQLTTPWPTYTPGPGFQGNDTIPFTVSDGHGGSTQDTLTIYDTPPVASNDSFQVAGTNPVPLDVLANDSDADGDPISIASSTNGAHGTTQISGNQIIYTPGAGYSGSDTFTYTISDGYTTSAPATVTIQSAPVDQIVLTDYSIYTQTYTNYTVALNSGLYTQHSGLPETNGATSLNIQANFPPFVSQPVAVAGVRASVQSSALTFSGVMDFSVYSNNFPVPNNAYGDEVWMAQLSHSMLLSMSGSASGSNGGFGGITVIITNNGQEIYHSSGFPSQPLSIAAGSFSCQIESNSGDVVMPPYNGGVILQPPLLPDYGYRFTASLAPIPLPVNDAFHPAGAGPFTFDVLANDTDPANYPLTIASATNGSFGTVQVSGNKVVYTPGQGYNGNDSFTYTVSDGHGGTAQATVTLSNTVPVAVNDSYHLQRTGYGPFTFDVLANDTDADGDSLTITSVTDGDSGTTQISNNKIVYTRNSLGYKENDFFTYTISDGHGGSAQATVMLTAPNAINDSYHPSGNGPFTFDVLANDSDADGDVLTITSVTNGSAGTTQISNNKVVYTPLQDYHGNDTFTYTISDGHGASDQATVTLTNATPIAVNDTFHFSGSGPFTLDVLANDTDADGDSLFIAGVALGASGTVQISNNKIVYIPGPNYNGNDSFNYLVSDGHGGYAVATVTLHNTPPVANALTIICNGSAVTANLLSHVSDADHDTLTIISVTNGSVGTASTDGTSVTYTPGSSFSGSDHLTYSVSDGHGAVVVAAITIVPAYPENTPTEKAGKAGTGDSVPGAAPSTTFVSFGIPAIDDSGDPAFSAVTLHETTKNSILFAKGTLQYSSGDSIDSVIPGASLGTFSDPTVDHSGNIAFLATLKGLKHPSKALFVQSAGNLRLVAQTGANAPGLYGSFQSISAFTQTDSAIFFQGTVADGASTTSVLYGDWSGGSGPTLLLKSGLFGKRVKTFLPLTPQAGSSGQGRSAAGNDLVLRVTFSDGSQSLFRFASGVTSTVASTGDHPAGTTSGVTFHSFGKPIINSAGGCAFRAVLAGDLTKKTDHSAIFADQGSGIFEILAAGDPVFVSGFQNVTIATLADPVFNSQGDVAVVATLAGPNLTAANHTAIIYVPNGGSPQIVARTGTQAAQITAGGQWKSFSSIALPDNLGPVFTANLAIGRGGIRASNAFGVWAMNSVGDLQVVISEGDIIGTQPIRTIALLSAAKASPDQTRSFNTQTQLVYRATFSGGTEQIFTVLVP